ncbi:MAG: redoxin domain-containing protein [Pirellulales bacterium]|nr:redoxin domain-containing protein [Pirellulales bacterium]
MPGWQAVYDELKSQNFEIIAAAQDTGGEQACGKFYDSAKATFTTLIDVDHVVSTAFQMVNVPTGVWIDEQGHIVRPPEVAYSKQMKVLGQVIGDDRYVAGLRDWVKHGANSRFVAPAKLLERKLAARPLRLRQADCEFRLGTWFQAQGDNPRARAHWKVAQELNPDNWNYHRQDWSFHGSEALTKWLAKFRALGDRPYYEPAEFPATDADTNPPVEQP